MKLPSGKIPIDVLKEVVFRNLGARRREVVMGPSVGVDGAVIDMGNCSIVVSIDPITGALDRIGLLAVNVNANDVATFGVEPAFLLSCILLPEGADARIVEIVNHQMDKAARELNMAIIGGHCEVTPGTANPVVIGCAMGITEKGNYVTSEGANNGDKLILTKSAGIEGTAILASDRETQLRKSININMLQRAKGFFDKTCVVKEAITAFKAGGVNAMHDPTEGGILGGVFEMAEASGLGVKVYEEKIHVRPETAEICKVLKIDPLRLVSSGALLIAAKPGSEQRILDALGKQKIQASLIGEFLNNPKNRKLIMKDGEACSLGEPTMDELWVALSRN